MKEHFILSSKVLGFVALTILLTSMSVHLRETSDTLLYWSINTLNSFLLVTVGYKAFDKK